MTPRTETSSLWQVVRPRLSFCKRQLSWLLKLIQTPKDSLTHFRCNVCGTRTRFSREEIARERWSCRRCASSLRARSVIHALSMELFGASLAIQDFPRRPDLTGIGLSDWVGIAEPLAQKLGYTNTFYHTSPQVDITHPDPVHYGRYDFIISSDVFEHICPPVLTAFENARKLLKPGGVMIFTVPYVAGETHEHFPDIREFSVGKEGERWVLTGTTGGGETRKFDQLTFHGGPGTTVECRLFGKDGLRRDCVQAGFEPIRVYGDTVEEFGIHWNPYVAEDAPYRPLIYGLDTPPWALVNGGGPTPDERLVTESQNREESSALCE